eukprot:2740053-Alexandrium_andersonii.AAC.1
MPDTHFNLRTVEPWVWTRYDQDPPDAEVQDPERAAWAVALDELLASSAGPISAVASLMDRFPGLLKLYPGDKNTLMLWLRENVEKEMMEGMRQPGTAAKQTARQAVYLRMQESAGA